MTELLTPLFAGFIALFIGLLKSLPLRPGERDPEWVLAIVSIIALLIFVAGITGLIVETPAAYGRMFLFYIGTVAAYFLSRFIPRREREAPQLPPEYLALSRQRDETFKAMKDQVARGGEPSQRDALKLEAYAKMLDENSEAVLNKVRYESRMVKLAAIVGTAIFLAYLVMQYLTT